MVNNVFKVAAAFIASVLTWFGLVHFLYNDSYGSLASLFAAVGIDPFSGEPTALVCLAVACALLFATLAQLFLNRFWRPFFLAEAALYVVVLLIVVFVKSQGIQGLNIDPTDIVSQIALYPTSVLLNVAIFIPMGLITHCRIKSTGKALLAALIGILAIELIQYLFALGIADIVDVMVNMMGFVVGYLVARLLYNQGVRLVRTESASVYRFARDASVHRADLHVASKRSAIALVSLAAVICLGFVLVYTFYDHDDYVEWDDSPQPTEDAVLSTLPLASDPMDADQAREEVADLTFGDASSSNGWLASTKGGFLCAEGTVAETDYWLSESGEECCAVTLAVEEKVDNAVVCHALPLVIMRDSRIVLDGEPLDLADGKAMGESLDMPTLCTAEVSFSVQDGWLHVESASFTSTDDALTVDAHIPYDAYAEEREATREMNGRGLVVPEGTATSFEGYVDAYAEAEDGSSFLTVRVNDLLGSALIAHSFSVACSPQSDAYVNGVEPSVLTVTLDSQGPRLVE